MSVISLRTARPSSVAAQTLPISSAPISLPLFPFIAVAIALGTFVSLAARSPLPIPFALLVAVIVRSRISRTRTRAAEAEQRAAVVELCAALRGELQAGRQASAAFAEAVWCRPELRDLAEAVSVPDPQRSAADLLTEAAHTPGREGLAALAACWRAAELHGVSLTGAVSGIEDGLRAEQARRQNLAVELSGARSTAAVLGVLPLIGLALGSALGVDPVRTLFGQPAGQICLLAGCLLDLAGLRWIDRLVASAESTASRAGPVRQAAQLPLRGLIQRWRT